MWNKALWNRDKVRDIWYGWSTTPQAIIFNKTHLCSQLSPACFCHSITLNNITVKLKALVSLIKSQYQPDVLV